MTNPGSRSRPHSARVGILYTTVPKSKALPEDVKAAEDLTENARAVQKALEAGGYCVRAWPFRSVAGLCASVKAFRPDVVFNLAEAPMGSYEREADAAAFLELLAVPYTGSGPLALALCKNKALAKQLLAANGIPTPQARVFSRVPPARLPLAFPLVVKPLCEDGSFGITEESVVKNFAQLRRGVARLLKDQGQPALVEEFVGGREFNVSVVGNGTAAAPYRVLPPGEYVYHSPRWRICTFDAKWNVEHPSYAAVEAVYPAGVEKGPLKELERLTVQAAALFGLKGYARLDFRLDRRGTPQLLDVNPNPDLAPGMGLARAAETAGMPYGELLGMIVRLALEKKKP